MILLKLPPMLQNILQKLGLSAHFCSNVGVCQVDLNLKKTVRWGKCQERQTSCQRGHSRIPNEPTAANSDCITKEVFYTQEIPILYKQELFAR